MNILKSNFKLPLEVINDDYTDLEDAEGVIVATINTHQNDAITDANYIVQACNNFPEAIKLLEEAKSFKRIIDYERWIKRVEEFLKSLEENGK